MVRPQLNNTTYELLKGRKSNISHMRVFGCKCFVLNNGKSSLGKFDARSDKGIVVGYDPNSKAYKLFSKRTEVVEESIQVLFDKKNPKLDEEVLCDEFLFMRREKSDDENDSSEKGTIPEST